MKSILFVICIAGISLLIAGIHLSTNNLELSRDNIGWNGSSEFFLKLDRHTTEMISDLSLLRGRQGTMLLLIAPDSSYDDSEIQYIRDYIRSGNSLILVDESDTGNQLLKALESRISVGPFPLASIDRAYNNPTVIVVSPEGFHPLTSGVTSVVLDKARPLTGGTPLLMSGIMSWTDTNGDLRISSGESFGRYPALSREDMGNGEIIVLSDTSICINTLQMTGNEWGNQQLITNILHYRPLLVEQARSRTAKTTWFGLIFRMVQSDPHGKAGLVLIVLLMIAVLVRRRSLKDDKSSSEPIKM